MFHVKVLKEITFKEGCWKYLDVGIYDKDDVLIGQYERNYSTLYETFFPFERNGNWYALYSPKYSATRVMKLPECKDIGGEIDNIGNGFCPIEYLVLPPKEYEGDNDDRSKLKDIAFVKGCHWGDDSVMHVAAFDISDVENGNIIFKHLFNNMDVPDLPLNKIFDFYRFSDEEPFIMVSKLKILWLNTLEKEYEEYKNINRYETFKGIKAKLKSKIDNVICLKEKNLLECIDSLVDLDYLEDAATPKILNELNKKLNY